jgi:hypothetical protein
MREVTLFPKNDITVIGRIVVVEVNKISLRRKSNAVFCIQNDSKNYFNHVRQG